MASSITRLIVKRRQRQQEKRTKRIRDFWIVSVCLVLFVAFILIPMGIGVGRVWLTYLEAEKHIPSTMQQTLATSSGTGITRLYDSAGRTLLFAVSDLLGTDREWLTLDDLPDYVASATVIWEDPNFYQSPPTDLIVMGERLWRNWLGQTPAPDNSITQRLIRRVILNRAPDQPITQADRALEIALLTALHRRYTPDQILEWHLNTNYYGHEAYGIDAASRVYLGKSARDLTIDEVALLATIPTQPELNPIDYEARTRDRQADLLRRLRSNNILTQSEFEAVVNVQTPVLATDGGQMPEMATDFSLYARRQAETILNNLGYDGVQLVTRGGLRIITTLDIDLYHQADCVIQAHFTRLEGWDARGTQTRDGRPCLALAHLPAVDAIPTPPDEGAIVVISSQTGEILTMNGATTRDLYQPAPVLYPLVYLHGFLNTDPNYTGASMLLDIPRTYPTGESDSSVILAGNPSGQFQGVLTLREAMSAGLVPPVFDVANHLNINEIILNTAHRMGFNGLRDGIYNLSLLGRGGAVSVLDTAYTYSVFAGMGDTHGVQVPNRERGMRTYDPIAVRRIEDAEGHILWNYDATQILASRIPVLQPEFAYLVNDILAEPTTRAQIFGEDNVLNMPRRAGVINGISSDSVDNWTVGYTPQLTIAVHLGRADRAPMPLSGFGIDGAAHVWRAVMDYLNDRDDLMATDWARPADLIQAPVCLLSGMSPNGICETRTELFLRPAQVPPQDTYWQIIEVNTQSGYRASVTTPLNLRNSLTYFIPPDDALEWWQFNNKPLPPQEYDPIARQDMLSPTTILYPNSYDTISGTVEVRVSLNPDDMAHYQVAYGEGMNPRAWVNIMDEETSFVPGVSLAQWDTGELNGIYVLRLQVVRQDNTVDNTYVQVIVDNTPPSVTLQLANEQTTIRYPETQSITLMADVVDNVSVARVEFYYNGQLIHTDTEYPFQYDHMITRTGTEQFTVVAYDTVGLVGETSLTVDVIRN
jgi:membrane peptidoglycan carboxypeptidase